MFITDSELAAQSSICHGFFSRAGGVSKGIYDSMNCGLGSNDDAAAVIENRARVAAALEAPPEQLLTVWQQHSAVCVTVAEAWSTAIPASLPKGDAMVTAVPGFLLGILTADCAPVLFYGADKKGRPVIGAAHAGWKGALGGILAATVNAMRDLGAVTDGLRAVIGPCLAQTSYEVSAEFMTPFMAQDKSNAAFFAPGANETVRQFNLPAYVAAQLARAGVRNIGGGRVDTYPPENNYFSYRRTTHRRETDYGRQLSVIGLRQ